MKQLFDAIRAIKGAALTQAEVDAVNGALGLAGGRKPSHAIEIFIKDTERLAKVRADGRVQAYLPTPNDVPTIGYGSTGPDITMSTIWTKAQCEARFSSQLAQFADSVDDMLGSAPTTQGQFDAMVSLAYNIGLQAFRESTLKRMHLEGNYAGAKAQFARWNKQSGIVLAGLTTRRAAEAGFYGAEL